MSLKANRRKIEKPTIDASDRVDELESLVYTAYTDYHDWKEALSQYEGWVAANPRPQSKTVYESSAAYVEAIDAALEYAKNQDLLATRVRKAMSAYLEVSEVLGKEFLSSSIRVKFEIEGHMYEVRATHYKTVSGGPNRVYQTVFYDGEVGGGSSYLFGMVPGGEYGDPDPFGEMPGGPGE